MSSSGASRVLHGHWLRGLPPDGKHVALQSPSYQCPGRTQHAAGASGLGGSVGSGVGDGVTVGSGVGASVGLGVGEGVGEGVGDGVTVGSGVGDGVTVGNGVGDGVGSTVGSGVGDSPWQRQSSLSWAEKSPLLKASLSIPPQGQ